MERKADISLLEKSINYIFNDKDVVNLALTHSSYSNESKGEKTECNERLEFLGDSVLSFIVSTYLYFDYPKSMEGDLSRIRAASVCTASLASLAREINLGDYLILGNGEELTNGRNKDSILENAFEALIAAIYIDGGIEKAKEFLLPRIIPVLENNSNPESDKDYKSILQQKVQKDHTGFLKYKTVSESGPAHKRVFEVEVWLDTNLLGKGVGFTKKEAEKNAAKEALTYFPDQCDT